MSCLWVLMCKFGISSLINRPILKTRGKWDILITSNFLIFLLFVGWFQNDIHLNFLWRNSSLLAFPCEISFHLMMPYLFPVSFEITRRMPGYNHFLSVMKLGIILGNLNANRNELFDNGKYLYGDHRIVDGVSIGLIKRHVRTTDLIMIKYGLHKFIIKRWKEMWILKTFNGDLFQVVFMKIGIKKWE